MTDNDLPPAKAVEASSETSDVAGGHDNRAVHIEELAAAGEVGNRIVKMLEHVEHYDQIEPAIRLERLERAFVVG